MAKPSNFDPQQKELVMEIFREGYVEFQDEHLPLIKNGVLSYIFHKNFRWLVFFSSPWIKKCYLQAMYCKLPPKIFKYFDPVKPNIDDFICEALSRMSKKRIMDGANLNATETPTEYIWQSEFYRAACSCLETDSSCISPELYTNGEHYLNFYISSMLKYGFELLKDGCGIQEHISCFAPGGSYHGLAEDQFILHRRVIDFRLEQSCKSTKMEVIYACFDEANGHFTVVKNGQQTEVPLVE